MDLHTCMRKRGLEGEKKKRERKRHTERDAERLFNADT